VAILGNSDPAGAGSTGFVVGRLWGCKFLAPESGVISELHGWYNCQQEPVTMAVFGPSGLNQAGALLGYGSFDPGPIVPATIEAVATGLSIPFSAGVVWLGFTPCAAFGGTWCEAFPQGGPSGQYLGIASAKLAGAAAACVPNDPFPAIDFGPDDRKHNIWAVYTPSVVPNLPLAPPTIHGRGAA
jgi:hypothetical protein